VEKDIQRFFEMALRRMYSAENQIYDFLNVAAEKATLQQLKGLLVHHRKETAFQIDRLKKVFELLNFEIGKTKIGEAEGLLEKGKEIVKSLATMAFAGKSKAMEGAIEEADEMLKHFEDSASADAIIMAGGQGLEMGEIAAYEVLCLIAEQNGLKEVASLLKSSLNEEKHTHEVLMQLLKKELQN
jgi:ferritin-like metal-binding protein YciE